MRRQCVTDLLVQPRKARQMIKVLESARRMFAQVKAEYFPEIPQNFATLGGAYIAVPPPKKQAAKVVEQKQADAYIIQPETNTYGFRSNRATDVHEGSVPHLTNYDVQALIDRELWGAKGRKGATANAKTATAKALWHDGCTPAEIQSGTGMSESWVEKRVAAFAAALSAELSEK